MKSIAYFEILKKALLIAWKNKFLWVFGLLVSLGSGISNMNWNMGKVSPENEEQAEKILNFIQQNPKIFIGIVFAAILLMMFFLFLRIMGNAGIIKAASDIAVYSQSTVKNIFKEIKKYFWPLFLVEAIVGMTILAVVLAMLIPVLYLFSIKSFVFATVSFSIALIILIPLIILACFIRKYACFYVVIGNIKVKMALEYAYGLFIKNIKESLTMGIIAFAIGIAAIVPILFFIFVSIVIFALLGLLFYVVFAKIGGITILIVGIIFGGLSLLIFSSAYATFMQTAWVLFFQEISLEKQRKKIATEKNKVETEIPDPEVV